ncbi:MAG: precorrin-6y C5,15-methyltransferase (decarboxylating) subunit CbiE [Deltaproteobacteria bacterium]|jgi:precorrin-6Y C5,15-methyltransferase (decarboxylating)|nr:precorrin-6y C5,15-methyltransferase (decarboxylating) subunit CbiE [Deltaproteobacteria bacterium]
MHEASPPLTILGLDDPADLPPSSLRLLAQAEVVAAPRRKLDELLAVRPELTAELLPLDGPLTGWLTELEQVSRRASTVVLATGDPNYFGLAKRILEVVPPERAAVVPAVTTVQKAFARLKVTWAGTEVQSLHGRGSWRDFWAALYRAGQPASPGRLALYTDPTNSPNLVAERLTARGQLGWRLHVFEDLGGSRENWWRGSLKEAARRTFSPLNLAVLERDGEIRPTLVGAPEASYAHEAGLITKSEVRCAALGLLDLGGDETFWDLGCGSGAVSVEAGRLLTHGELWAVDQSRARLDLAAANRSRFGTAHLELVEGDALEVMDELPRPDRIFVGGGGARLREILSRARRRLAPGGTIVASVVRLAALTEALEELSSPGRPASAVQLMAARGHELAGSLWFKPQNQVWLVKGRAPGDDET